MIRLFDTGINAAVRLAIRRVAGVVQKLTLFFTRWTFFGRRVGLQGITAFLTFPAFHVPILLSMDRFQAEADRFKPESYLYRCQSVSALNRWPQVLSVPAAAPGVPLWASSWSSINMPPGASLSKRSLFKTPVTFSSSSTCSVTNHCKKMLAA